jgi:hypothetical protein
VPENGEVVIEALGTQRDPMPIQRVELLGADQPVMWTRGDDALRITLPAGISNTPALVFKIE